MESKSSAHIQPLKMDFADAHNNRYITHQENVVRDSSKNIYLTLLNEQNDYIHKQKSTFIKNGRGEQKIVEYKAINYDKVFDDIKQKYQQINGKGWGKRRGPRVGKSEIFKEMVVNTKSTTTKEDLIRLTKNLEKMGISVLELSLHNDEGHYLLDDNDNDNKTIKYNHHLHVIFCNCNDESKIKRWQKGDLQKLQDVVAESLGMERGARGSKAKRLSSKQYKIERQKDNELAKKMEPDLLQKAYQDVGQHFKSKLNDNEISQKIQKKTINELSELNDELINDNSMLKAKNNELNDLFKALGLDEFLQLIKDSKNQYKTAREQLKESGIATQNDYQQLKINHENLLKKLKLLKEENKILSQKQNYTSINLFDNLAQKYTFNSAKNKLEELEELGLKQIITDPSKNLLDEFLQFLKLQLGIRYIEYQNDKSSYLAIKTDEKNFIQPEIIKTKNLQIFR